MLARGKLAISQNPVQDPIDDRDSVPSAPPSAAQNIPKFGAASVATGQPSKISIDTERGVKRGSATLELPRTDLCRPALNDGGCPCLLQWKVGKGGATAPDGDRRSAASREGVPGEKRRSSRNYRKNAGRTGGKGETGKNPRDAVMTKERKVRDDQDHHGGRAGGITVMMFRETFEILLQS